MFSPGAERVPVESQSQSWSDPCRARACRQSLPRHQVLLKEFSQRIRKLRTCKGGRCTTSFFLWDTSTRAASAGMISSSGRTSTPRTSIDGERDNAHKVAFRYGLARSIEEMEKKEGGLFKMLYTYGEDRNQVIIITITITIITITIIINTTIITTSPSPSPQAL